MLKVSFKGDGEFKAGDWLGSVKLGDVVEITQTGSHESTRIDASLVHEREAKFPKEIVWIPPPAHAKGESIFPPELAYDMYDDVVAIDTNRKTIDGKVYVAGCYLSHKEEKWQSFFHQEDIDKPESAAWAQVIQKLANEKPGKTILVIVDSDLGSLDDYNSRKKPFWLDTYLPENFKFGYASADKSDTAFNRMIKLCDRYATEQIEELVKAQK